jgi:hypothetical protein
MRVMSRGSYATVTSVTAAVLSLSLPALTTPERAWAAAVGAQAVVAQETVVAKPYELALAPDGEFRILHFDAGLVNSVLVAKPWLLTVLIQGNDVVLQAKATSGTTQLVAYVGDTGTLWQVEIASHPSAPTRIVVRAPGEEAAPRAAAPPPHPPARTGQPASQQDPRLTAFLGALTPEQRAGFDAWQRGPTAAALAEWMATLPPEQRAAFDALVQAHVVTVSSPLGPDGSRPGVPPLVDTTTVIGPSSVAPPPNGGAPSGPAVPSATVQASMADALHVDVENVPQGLTVQASATRAADGIRVPYAIHNGLGASLAAAHVVATDGQGHAVAVSGVPTDSIAAGKDSSGVLTVRASSFPVVLRWVWDERTNEKVTFVSYAVSRGVAQFDVVVTP